MSSLQQEFFIRLKNFTIISIKAVQLVEEPSIELSRSINCANYFSLSDKIVDKYVITKLLYSAIPLKKKMVALFLVEHYYGFFSPTPNNRPSVIMTIQMSLSYISDK